MSDKQVETSPLSNDLKLLISCCQLQVDSNELQLQIANEELEIARLGEIISLATRHGILPLLYKSFSKILTKDAALSKLKHPYMSVVQRNMLMTAELLRVHRLLAKHHIKALSFKGPALAQMVYGDITLRQFGDLDMLIKKADRSKMMSLFLSDGYLPEIALTKENTQTFFDAVNVIGLHHPSKGIRIEVHWELLSTNYAIDWEEEVLWSTVQHIQLNHSDIPVLSLEQHLLYLCAHGSKHLFERLEWVCDIDRSIRTHTNLDWDFLHNQAEKLGIKRMLFLGLALSQQFFITPLPTMIEKQIIQDKEIEQLISKVIDIHFSNPSKTAKSYSSFWLLWHMRENVSDKLRFAWRGLFAPKFDDFLFIQLPKPLVFLYPLVRPYRLITKYFHL